MRKACMAGISVLIGISMLAGCGKSLDADTDTVYVQKNGTVLSVDVETLDKDYYDETELKDYVTMPFPHIPGSMERVRSNWKICL